MSGGSARSWRASPSRPSPSARGRGHWRPPGRWHLPGGCPLSSRAGPRHPRPARHHLRRDGCHMRQRRPWWTRTQARHPAPTWQSAAYSTSASRTSSDSLLARPLRFHCASLATHCSWIAAALRRQAPHSCPTPAQPDEAESPRASHSHTTLDRPGAGEPGSAWTDIVPDAWGGCTWCPDRELRAGCRWSGPSAWWPSGAYAPDRTVAGQQAGKHGRVALGVRPRPTAP